MKLNFKPPTLKFKMPNLSFLDPVMNFLNSRNPREKIMIVALGGVALLALDYFLILGPVVAVFANTGPKLGPEKAVVKQLRDDKKNKAGIDKDWEDTKQKLKDMDGRFINSNGIPALLENISKLASDSGLRIMALKPTDPGKSDYPGYSRVPIHITALAGTHELGRFLAKVESGQTFFRVANLRIIENETEQRRHGIELDIETYRKLS